MDEQAGQPTGPDDAPRYADVAVDAAQAPGDPGELTYALPAELAGRVGIGQLVWVPLRRQVALGIVTRLHDDQPDFATRPVQACVEPAFRLDPAQMATARWLARETVTSTFSACAPFLPPGVTHRAVEYLRLADPEAPAPDNLTPAQRRLWDLLHDREEVSLDAARTALGTSLAATAKRLEQAGVVERVVQVVDRAPSPKVERHVRLRAFDPSELGRSPRQLAVLEWLAQRARFSRDGGPQTILLADLLEGTGADHGVVAALERRGLVDVVTLPKGIVRDPVDPFPAPALSPAQAEAWTAIEAALQGEEFAEFLLQGVTGSGKTEIYLRACAWCLRQGRSAIVLVPEIALAAQVVRRFEGRFPGKVAVMHSELSDSERYATWQAIRLGQLRIVVGPRSALFAPVEDLGLVVIDEEHEGAYKQDTDPRYHARSLAEEIARQADAVLVLGSATPSVETHWRAEQGEIALLELPDRVAPGQAGGLGISLELPPVEIVDMRNELHQGRTSLLSRPLEELVRETLARKEQAILFLNRRGLSTVVLCQSCGESVDCPHCDVPLVYHGDRERLICHRCNFRAIPPARCAACGGGLVYLGAGTQRVEAEAQRLFPGATIMRWDADAVRQGGGHHKLLGRVERGEVDIIVGTQMVAKGLDLPLVTAIGVISADAMLYLPDFRSGERTFQMLTQVAGRAGRRAGGGKVIVQTYTPDHYAIVASSRHDYAAFAADEIDFRSTNAYPPFSRLIRFLVRDESEERCVSESDLLAREVARHAHELGVTIDILGPAPAFATRVRGRYGWQFVVRGEPAGIDRLLDGLPTRRGWVVDVDPQSVL